MLQKYVIHSTMLKLQNQLGKIAIEKPMIQKRKYNANGTMQTIQCRQYNANNTTLTQQEIPPAHADGIRIQNFLVSGIAIRA